MRKRNGLTAATTTAGLEGKKRSSRAEEVVEQYQRGANPRPAVGGNNKTRPVDVKGSAIAQRNEEHRTKPDGQHEVEDEKGVLVEQDGRH